MLSLNKTIEDAVWVTGGTGLVGSAVVRMLLRKDLVVLAPPRRELNLMSRSAVDGFVERCRPKVVVHCAGLVGGIGANSARPVEFGLENIRVQTNVIEACAKHGTQKLVVLGSSCIYPRLAPQPIKEEHLLTGPLEPTNEMYALAKIFGMRLCRAYHGQYKKNFVALMPTNMYGPGDNYDLANSHVVPGMIRRIHEAKIQQHPHVLLWGTGAPRRDLLFVDDFAEAVWVALNQFDAGVGEGFLNVGNDEDISIRDLATEVADAVGYEGEIWWDETKPDGMPRKLIDTSKIRALGWKPTTSLRVGLRKTYDAFLEKYYPLPSK